MTILLDLLRPVTDEELLRFSERNPGYQFERTSDGRLVVGPTGGESGRRSLKVAYQLETWNEHARLGMVFGSSTGFRLPDGSLLSPDASWMRRERWEALSREEREGFVSLCPDCGGVSPGEEARAARQPRSCRTGSGASGVCAGARASI